jgi:hypothetical protein
MNLSESQQRYIRQSAALSRGQQFAIDKAITRRQLVAEPIPGFTARIVLQQAVRQLNDHVQQTMETLVAETLMDYVRIRASKGARVDIRRPRWMPESLHRWLIRQIVVVETPTTVSTQESHA